MSGRYALFERELTAMQEAAVIAKREGRRGRLWRSKRTRNFRAVAAYHRTLYELLVPPKDTP